MCFICQKIKLREEKGNLKIAYKQKQMNLTTYQEDYTITQKKVL